MFRTIVTNTGDVIMRIVLNRSEVSGRYHRIHASIFLQDLRYLLVLKTRNFIPGDLPHFKVNAPHDFKQLRLDSWFTYIMLLNRTKTTNIRKDMDYDI
jgi:hypothetical protein